VQELGGDVAIQTSTLLATGTTLQSLGDRNKILVKNSVLTDNVATIFATVTVPDSNSAIGGVITYTIKATDGTDFQVVTGIQSFSAINKAGTVTVVFDPVVSPSNLVTAGTLSAPTFTTNVTGTTVEFLLQIDSSLTTPVITVQAQAIKNFGTGVISAQ